MQHNIFVDANVLIAGAGSRSGASRAVLMLAEIGLFQLVVSELVLEEAERNLRKKLPHGLPVFAEILAHLHLKIVPAPSQEMIAHWIDSIEEKDAPIIAAAVAAQVDRLLTLNHKDFTPEVAAQSGIRIQSPAEFIQDIRALINTTDL